MSQSLSKLYIHLVFHVKNNHVLIRDEEKKDLYAYMGSIIKDNNSIPIIINGTDNHVHVFFVMSKNISLARLTEEIKRHSSRWIKTKSPVYTNFAWQGEYAGFSVSPSLFEKTKNYILNQEEHHKKMDFKDEFVHFLKESRIDYNEQFLFEN